MTPIHPRPAETAHASGDISTKDSEVESAILLVVAQRESCTLDELLLTLSDFTFNQVLISVDRLSREGRVNLRRPTQFTYRISRLLSEPRTQPHTEDSRGGFTQRPGGTSGEPLNGTLAR